MLRRRDAVRLPHGDRTPAAQPGALSLLPRMQIILPSWCAPRRGCDRVTGMGLAAALGGPAPRGSAGLGRVRRYCARLAAPPELRYRHTS